MADDQKEPTEAEARERVEEARAELEEAQQDLQVQVARGGMAHLVCEVLPENTISHGGDPHFAGDRFAVEGLTAVGLMQNGHVKIVGTHDQKHLPRNKAHAKQLFGAADVDEEHERKKLFAPDPPKGKA